MSTAKLRGIARAAPDMIAMLIGLGGLVLSATGLIWKSTATEVQLVGLEIHSIAGIAPTNVIAISGLVIVMVSLGVLYR